MIDEPKRVLEFEDNDGEIDGRTITRTIYECPNCLKILIQYEDRCPMCEQKLRWWK